MIMQIRKAQAEDGEQIGQLIYDTVRVVNRQHYSEEQVKTWAPDPIIYSTYENSMAFVVERDQKIVGFSNLLSNGYIARFYVHKDFQRRGVGNLMLETIENQAKELGLTEITTEASITAKPFFLAHGFHMREQQTKILRDVSFINYKMFKRI